jgi:uncharacterized protein (TIGR02284 family)
MSQHTERTVLNHLIEICTDGERGFTTAAEQASDPELKSLFTDLARQRRAFADALIPHAQRLGGDAAADGTSIGRLHRGWMNLKGKISGHHDHVILEEAERGEDAAVRAYRDALNEVLAPAARELVEQQCEAIAKAHEHIRAVASGVMNPPA